MKTREGVDIDGRHQAWIIFCPACRCGHAFDDRWTYNGDADRPTFRASMLVRMPGWCQSVRSGDWVEYYRDVDPKTGDGTCLRVPMAIVGADCEPTLEAVAARLGLPADLEQVREHVERWLDSLPPYVCHSFVTDGRIQFLGDCTHPLAGQTVDLPDFEESCPTTPA